MTTCCPLAQIPMAALAPVERTVASGITLEVTLAATDGRIMLEMRQCGCKDQDYIVIEDDCDVTILLKGDQIFLSKEYDAITLKGDFGAFYGGLVYDGYDRERGRYKQVTFRARLNKGGKRGTSHPFNINVDLYQPGGKPEWIGLTIDPDIKNPPPYPF